MSYKKCNLCKKDNSSNKLIGKNVYGGKKVQRFYLCSYCSVAYLYPRLTLKEETNLYSKEFEKFMSKRSGKDMNWDGPEDHVKSSEREAVRRMRFLKKYIKKNESILEVGCSSGFMLMKLKKNHKVSGIDPSGKFLEFVKSKKIECFKNYTEIKNKKTKFDIILHYYVLEHIRNPFEFLEKYLSHLNSGGKMIFEIPNYSDPLISLYKNKKFDKFYWSVVHHWYFNKKSLEYLLGKLNMKFEILPEQRYDLSNHIEWMNNGKPGGYAKYNDVFTDKLNHLYKKNLINKWKCDTLIAIIYK